jgi:hypothetical protein
MDPELASKLIKNARDATITAAIMIAVVVGVLNKDDIMASVVAMTNRMQTAEFAGVKISFGEQAYALNPSLSGTTLPQRREIRDVLDKLTAEEVERLLHRTEYPPEKLSPEDLNCDYEKATSDMMKYRWADKELSEMKLFRLIEKPEFTDDQHSRLPPDVRAKLGDPSGCYQIVLTPLGSNVKSVLVTELSRAFSASSPRVLEERDLREKNKPSEYRPSKKN